MNSAAESDVDGRYEVYKKAISMNSHAATPKRVPLYFLHGIFFTHTLHICGCFKSYFECYSFVIFDFNLNMYFRCPI